MLDNIYHRCTVDQVHPRCMWAREVDTCVLIFKFSEFSEILNLADFKSSHQNVTKNVLELKLLDFVETQTSLGH
jgi:hypothetical protein